MRGKTLGERIRELRNKQDLSLREFGEKLGRKTAAFLSDIELGRRFPSPAVLEEMARVLKTTVEDLKNYDPRPAVEGIKKLASGNSDFALAFRTVVEKDIKPEDLMNLAKGKPARPKER